MNKSKVVKLSSSCWIEVNHWEVSPPDASVVYTELGDGWTGDREIDATITLEKAQEIIEILQEYVDSIRIIVEKRTADPQGEACQR